jgi:hypothetical protein
MIKDQLKRTYKTGKSEVVTSCQICGNKKLIPIIFLGYMPPVNSMPVIGSRPKEEPSFPAQLLYCSKCHLVQIGLIVDPVILFPKSYPYTSGTTKVLRENFADLYKESSELIGLKKEDLVVDVGSNDGTLLSNFKDNAKIVGITPEDIGKIAIKKGIPTVLDYFNDKSVQVVLGKYGKARVVTAANVFAHVEHVHEVVENVIKLLTKDGVFISESHYLFPLINDVQYDTIYHEHLRYYSLHSLIYLLRMHGLEVFHVKEIPSHGGSIRVYASKKGNYKADKTVSLQIKKEKKVVTDMKSFRNFEKKVIQSKLDLAKIVSDIKKKGDRIYGISAPSRGTTLINYLGFDAGIIDVIVEVKGSYKIGHYVPGTLIPVVDEEKLFKDQPEYALLLSWHITDELVLKLREKGFKGKFIKPLSAPTIL